MFIAIYNPETSVVLYEKEVDDTPEGAMDYQCYELECLNRGYPWQPYKGETPYEFPKEAIESEAP